MKVLFVGGTGKLGEELIRSKEFNAFQITRCSSRNTARFREIIEKELISFDIILYNSFDSKDDYFQSLEHYEKASLAPLEIILNRLRELKTSPKIILISSIFALLNTSELESSYVTVRKKTEAHLRQVMSNKDLKYSIVRRGIVVSNENIGLQKLISAASEKLDLVLNFPVEYGLPVTRLDYLISCLKEVIIGKESVEVNCIDMESNLLDTSKLRGLKIYLNPHVLDFTFQIGHFLKLPWNKWYALKLKSFKQIINDSNR